MSRRWKKRAQTTAEYAILLTIVVGALVAMQVYVKRGLQARIKQGVDYTDNDTAVSAVFNHSGQYEPYYLTGQTNTTQGVSQQVTGLSGGGVTKGSTTTSIANRTQNVSGEENTTGP